MTVHGMDLHIDIFGVLPSQKVKLFNMIADELTTGADDEGPWGVGTGKVTAVEYEDDYEANRVEAHSRADGTYKIKRLRRRQGTDVWREIKDDA